MMDESDDDFKELCASFLQRVKKNVTKEVSGERKTQKASNSTQISKPKRTKPTATKGKTLQGPREKKTQSGSQAPRTKKQGAPKGQRSEPTPPENGEGNVLASAVLQEGVQSTQTETAPDSNSQSPPSCLTVTAPSPSKPRTAELVLQRMQQFKRADPKRLQHASEGSSLEATLEEKAPEGPPEEMTAGNGSGPGLPATESDAAVALALQQEFGQQRAPTHEANLEETGLFFCQICHKNLSAMNVTRREQHVNRCLDEAEKALTPTTPRIPECPICGKPFLSPKSRISHLKQCAVKMDVGPQLLLQAVRLQTAQPDGACGTLASSFSSHVGGLKRKGATNRKELQKKQKVNEPEDLLVAMALSRSEMEREAVPTVLRLESTFPERIRLGAEKKSRKRKAPLCPPPLLVQDPETTQRQTEDRVAQLFAEEMELSSTPPLPASRMVKEELEKAGRQLKQNFLWEGSALTGAWALEAFYTASLVPPMVPQPPAKGLTQEPTLPPVLPDEPELGVRTPPALPGAPPAGHGPGNPSPSASQREHQALQDLVDLAGEGLSATPWPCSGGLASSGGAAGMDVSPTGLRPTGFVLPPKEKPLERDSQASLTLSLLLADFRAMVNNPHLSDVQLQTDSGDVLYAHKFVLYARCPLLMQYVNSEGFFAVEDGDLRSQRVLLSDVSTEAARALLHYLYTADPGVPPRLAPGLSALAHRFGVSELVLLCEQAPDMSDSEDRLWKEKEDEECESRAENFQELLRSMWIDEEEEAEALLKSESHEEDREKVNEAEMEEIYEFAATQRKLLRGEGATEIKEETDQFGDDGPASAQILASGQVSQQPENAEQMESPGEGKEEAPATWKSVRQSTPLPLKGQCADEEKAGSPEEALSRSGSPHPSGGCKAGRKEGVFWCSADAPEARPFSSTPRKCRGLSQITSHLQEGNSTISGKRAGSPSTPARWQTPLWRPCLSQPPGGQRPGRPHPHPHLWGESPSPGPQPQGRASRGAAQDSPAKQRRGRSLLTLLKDPGLQKGKERGSSLECRNKGVLVSPEKSPSIDLTQSKPGHLSSRSQNTLSSKNREDEIILLLDSDEELELEQTKIKSVFNGPLEERKVLEVSPKSSELFSVIDVDADQEPFQSPARKEASLQGREEGPAGNWGSVGGRGIPWLSCHPESGPEEDSTTDTSWLVPATPLASGSRDSSSQTQITGLRSRASVDHVAQVKPWAPLENRGGSEATSKLPVITPQMSSSCLVPVRAGSPDSRSPSRPHPGHHQHCSLAPCPVSGSPGDLSGQPQKHSHPRPSLVSQAITSEVVEVEDSEDEQEAASRQASSSPLLDGDPPIPLDGCHWHVEPLSPIPIDRLNLERTGPLSTSGPGSRAGEAPDCHRCCSPTLQGTAPAPGSCAGRTESHEKAHRAGSPGSSRPSFLNSALWDDWDGEEEKSPELLPPAQRLSANVAAPNSEGLETPKGANRKNLPPKVPITPMPRYSIMETPVLKKELERFGVRRLPKRQMVLKLKEIFQYTHQTLESDSENESQSSQVLLEAPHSQTHASRTSKASRAVGHAWLEATSGPLPQRSKESTKTKDPRQQKKQPGGSIPPMSMSQANEEPPDPDGDAQLPASQESVASSVDSSDSSFSSQSSSCEFGVDFESAEDEEGEEELSTSQAAVHAAATEEAVRRYIRSRPALYRKVLLYQPFELAELQAELKQHGIHVATAKLLDFLDAHCITFTTAAARKEKLHRKRLQPVGKKRGRAARPVRPSPPLSVSSL
ncbi:structure-specific endonuclease subunit SLX4 isoform X1 [Eumetopias jubatus]|uniref:structure-specific endonuclease subunit SLX4 isoform X1 n=3 Tax=Eumetopias jubatus TaxID=34886 RepID=UPI001016E223|nr:structure-specific endonuclease subunit SLX4 isoform X1 [Eumetopias jubatus]XP_027973337.1 structure-specific endonuclease subunit SLX4 isoform X1 [Eumetopias jubatus]XP_027973338.1 structure-specific endonuclease subunit SLX4 isoform X1 [Eumetopias jubatus]XP_027973339.1 structure-specific endonuclease subunit SLX4 isoform X1 [Eumetopias jubatus]XP_027973340.1 structure-specific endonuclease subunit SLX4 isoform X1 [Eumetopias jubatus]